MKRCQVSMLSIVAGLSFLGSGIRATADEGVEVLTAGPVHEAFVGTVSFNPEPGVVAPKAPPPAIEELPPEQRPEGTNVAWIPGYFAWDDERNDFLWVSGIWRDLPPARQWVPGYFAQVTQGYQWNSGYWADAQANETEYLPQPPQSVENGPNVEAPSEDQTWLPGCWIWQQSRYAWRPGYWAAAQQDWVWVPDYYVWTPRGYVFVNGYWDCSVSRRGVLFAPVYFQANAYSQPGFSYSPATVINPAVFLSHLFLRPSYQHCYFGDYYAASYSQAGFYPGYSIQASHRGYDPIYAHQHWQNRQDRGWEQRVHSDFQRLRDNENARPPRTWSAQKQLSAGNANERGFVVAAPLDQIIKSKDNPLRFQPLEANERQRLAQRGQEVQKFGQERQKLESQAARTPAEARLQGNEPARVKLPTSPLAGKPIDTLGRGQGPLASPAAPKPDLTIEPKPRVNGSPEQPRPQPGEPPRPGTGPLTTPRVEQPTLQPQPKVEPTTPKLQPRVEPTTPKPQPQPPVEPTIPKAQPQPQVEPTTPKPQPRVEPTIPKPQPRVEQPKPQPRVEPTAPKPQPRVEQPAPKPQPQAQPKPTPQPKPQPQPQPNVKQPAPQPPGNPAAPARGPAGPVGSNPKAKEKGKG